MEKRFGWESLVVGILFVLASLLVLNNPMETLISITVVVACLMIIRAASVLYTAFKIKKYTGLHIGFSVVLALVSLAIGIYVLFNLGAGLIAIQSMFAAWFIVDSVYRLSMSGYYRPASKVYYWFSVIINIIGIFVGFSLLFDPIVASLSLAFIVSVYFMIFGILNIVAAFQD